MYSQKENRPRTLCRRKPLPCGRRVQVVKPHPPDSSRGSQRLRDQGLMEKTNKHLLHSTTDTITTARLHATATKESGAWLNALPVPHLGLRLGSDLVEEHKCVCGSQVSRKGTHGLRCRRSGGRFARLMQPMKQYGEFPEGCHLCWNQWAFAGRMPRDLTA